WPCPTVPRAAALGGETLRNNTVRVGTCCPELIIKNWSVKVDQVLTSKHKMVASFIENDRYRYRYGYGASSGYFLPGKIPNTPAAGDKKQSTPGYMIPLAEDWAISPDKPNHFGIGYNRFRNHHVSKSFFYHDNNGIYWSKALWSLN